MLTLMLMRMRMLMLMLLLMLMLNINAIASKRRRRGAQYISSLGFVHILGLELPELLLRDHALFCPSRDRKRQRPTKLHF